MILSKGESQRLRSSREKTWTLSPAKGRGSGMAPASGACESIVRSTPFAARAWASSPKKPGASWLRRCSSQNQRETINTFMAWILSQYGFEELLHRDALIFPKKLARPSLGRGAIDGSLCERLHGGGEGLG